MVDFGTDIDSRWTNTPQGDLAIVTGLSNAEQAVYNRLMTRLGELDWAEYTNYGSQGEEVIGETDLETAKSKIALYDTICLLQDPRVEDIYDVNVFIDDVGCAVVDISVKLIGEDNPSNFIIKHGE